MNTKIMCFFKTQFNSRITTILCTAQLFVTHHRTHYKPSKTTCINHTFMSVRNVYNDIWHWKLKQTKRASIDHSDFANYDPLTQETINCVITKEDDWYGR